MRWGRFCGQRVVECVLDGLVAEGKAPCLAVKLACLRTHSKVIFETDRVNPLFLAYQRGGIFLLYSRLYSWRYLVFMQIFFDVIVWSHVHRDGNFVAHHLARLVPFGTKQWWENRVPPKIVVCLCMYLWALSLNECSFPL